MNACDRLKAMTRDAADWDREHAPHGTPTFEPLAKAPEGYPAHWRVCSCGARIAEMKEAP